MLSKGGGCEPGGDHQNTDRPANGASNSSSYYVTKDTLCILPRAKNAAYGAGAAGAGLMHEVGTLRLRLEEAEIQRATAACQVQPGPWTLDP